MRVLSKSLGRYIPSGASSSEVPRALEDRLVVVESMARGGRFLGGDCYGNIENSRSQEQWNWARRSAASVQIGLKWVYTADKVWNLEKFTQSAWIQGLFGVT
jgi:hypothetical protein